MFLHGRPPGIGQRKTPVPSEDGCKAGAGFEPVLHHQSLSLIIAKWVYTPAKYGSREMRRIDPAFEHTIGHTSPS